MSKPKLVDVSELTPSTYNPRKSDEKRLDLIELSLRKLGWLIPIYATQDGGILSGHQRHLVAKRMGAKRVPVSYTPTMTLPQARMLNIAFNRATNDQGHDSTTQELTGMLERSDVDAIAAQLPDIEVDSAGWYRVLSAEPVAVDVLADVNRHRYDGYAERVSGGLMRRNIMMPVIATRDMRVLNGIGRVENAEMVGKHKFLPVVFLSDAEAEFARAMLNFLTMDFDIHTRYEDDLRYNSFRRGRHTRRLHGRQTLGLTYTALMPPSRRGNKCHLEDPEHFSQWVQLHGMSILDFGCGHGSEAKHVETFGIEAVQFEPYRIVSEGSNVISRPMSVALNRKFLEAIASGKEFTTIFCSAVFNSVPFHQDRLHIAQIMAACAGPNTQLVTRSRPSLERVLGWLNGERAVPKMTTAGHAKTPTGFAMDYEPHTAIYLNSEGMPKMQRWFDEEEFGDIFRTCFDDVRTVFTKEVVGADCRKPRITKEALRAAIEFEFDLPYPDGKRMGLVKEAKAAFGKRHGWKL